MRIPFSPNSDILMKTLYLYSIPVKVCQIVKCHRDCCKFVKSKNHSSIRGNTQNLIK